MVRADNTKHNPQVNKMKFSVATLLWLITIACIVIGSYLWVNQQRELANNKANVRIAESERKIANLKKGLEDELGKADYYRRQLGVIENSTSIKSPFIKLVRMPDDLGGRQSYKLPFTWQWRMILPKPDEFELCWTVHEIPADDLFDIPEEHLHRSHLNLKGGVSRAGMVHYDDNVNVDSDMLLGSGKPLEVCLFFRIDGDSERADVFINYQIVNSEKLLIAGLKRGEHIQLKSDDVAWAGQALASRGGYGAISGIEIERDNHVPLLRQNFSLDEPLPILKIRSKKELGPGKYEIHKEPCAGLLVWIQKKSGPSTDLPKLIRRPSVSK